MNIFILVSFTTKPYQEPVQGNILNNTRLFFSLDQLSKMIFFK